ncbi:putative RNA-directed DNA polymerase, eukaryota, reverse transcriptase zinc-binding domain protein [Tanacetum coccineum]
MVKKSCFEMIREALHITFLEAKAKGIFEGVKIGSNKVDVSNLQFADDAFILGKWSLENARTLCRILRCFNLASGLKVNFSKSKLFGVGVDASDIQGFANILDCQASTFPCSYLGLPIGANMSKACNWKPIIKKFHKQLTSWKARNLLYGGRLTLLKSVLEALGTYFFSLFLAPKCVINYLEKLRRNFFWGGTLDCNKMAWIGWKKVCSSYSCGGLGIDTPDQWVCSFISSKTYTVALMRKQLEHSLLSSNGEAIRWNRDLPIKINIHSWRISLDRIPTRFNLDKRGIDLHSTRCPVYDGAIETSQHLFVECPIVAHIWDSIMGWWGLPDHPKDLFNLITWSDTINLDNKIKACLDVVIQTTIWVIWNYRNRICFDLKPPRKDTLMEEIKVSSQTWILHRNKRFKPNWDDWVLNPIYSCNSCLISL